MPNGCLGGANPAGTGLCPEWPGCTCQCLKGWSLDEQHQKPLGACWKCRFPGPTPDTVNPKLWGWGPEVCILQSFFFFLNLFIYLFLAVLGLRFCARAFSSCDKRGPLFIAVRRPLTIAASCCGAQAPDAQAQQLWLTGLVAPRHVGSSQTRARTRVPCIGRQTLNLCATREAREVCILATLSSPPQAILMHSEV